MLAYSEFNNGGELRDHLRRNKFYDLDFQINYTVEKDGSLISMLFSCD
jgi:hypothetical protein